MQLNNVYCEKSPRPAYYPVKDGGRSVSLYPLGKYPPHRRAPNKIDDAGSTNPSDGKEEPSPGAQRQYELPLGDSLLWYPKNRRGVNVQSENEN
jgi:hypothetical protein